MARCEDWPCCGHEAGCCPDYDPDTGEQLNMKCVCGATLPLNSRSSLCNTCLRRMAIEDGEFPDYDDEEYADDMDTDDMDESMDGDFDSGMASAGFGTDEDYGYYGGDE